jgi:hypothetical protein
VTSCVIPLIAMVMADAFKGDASANEAGQAPGATWRPSVRILAHPMAPVLTLACATASLAGVVMIAPRK